MRTSLVTGGSSGIGLACARRLRRRGDALVLVGTDAAALDRVVDELGGREHVRAIAVDVADAAAVAEALAQLPALHTLVLAAGICRQAAIDAPEADAIWSRVLEVNLHGVWHVVRASLGRLVAGGRVIAVSSGLGKLGRAEYAAYCASKHGLLGLVKCMAAELAARGITVNAVCPGWVDTPMARADVEKLARARGCDVAGARAEIEAAIPIGRMVEADEVAALIEFLASPAAGAITGEAYDISGGEFFA